MGRIDARYSSSSVPQPSWLPVTGSAGTEFGIPVLEIDGNVVKSNIEIAKLLAEKYSKISIAILCMW